MWFLQQPLLRNLPLTKLTVFLHVRSQVEFVSNVLRGVSAISIMLVSGSLCADLTDLPAQAQNAPTSKWMNLNPHVSLPLLPPAARQNFSMAPTISADALLERENEPKIRENPALLYDAMLRTARAYVYEKHFDLADQKWQSAFENVQNFVIDDLPYLSHHSFSPSKLAVVEKVWKVNPLQRSLLAKPLMSLGYAFEHEDKLDAAEHVYFAAFKMAKSSDTIAPAARGALYELACSRLRAGDTAGGARILHQFHELTAEYRGQDSPQDAVCELKLANYYATGGDVKMARKFCKSFLAGLDGNETIWMQQVIPNMVESAHVLANNGFRVEADRLNRKITKIQRLEKESLARPVQL